MAGELGFQQHPTTPGGTNHHTTTRPRPPPPEVHVRPARAPPHSVRGVRRRWDLPARAPTQQVQGVWRVADLPAQARAQYVRGVRRVADLPAQAQAQYVRGVWRRWDLPARAPSRQVQGVQSQGREEREGLEGRKGRKGHEGREGRVDIASIRLPLYRSSPSLLPPTLRLRSLRPTSPQCAFAQSGAVAPGGRLFSALAAPSANPTCSCSATRFAGPSR